MGKTYEALDEALISFIRDQHVFFVATAPLAAEGLLNLSPKGLDTFRVLGPRTVAYLDLTGSGIETIAHLRDNGRIVVMFCAFGGPPKILRLHGRGRVVELHDAEYAQLSAAFPANAGARAVVVIDVARIADSCGYTLPLLSFEGDRDTMDKWVERKGPEGLVEYRRLKNAASLDGLTGLTQP